MKYWEKLLSSIAEVISFYVGPLKKRLIYEAKADFS